MKDPPVLNYARPVARPQYCWRAGTRWRLVILLLILAALMLAASIILPSL